MLARLLWWFTPGVHTQHIHRQHLSPRTVWNRYDLVGQSFMRGA